MHLRRSLTLLFPLGVLTIYLSSACSNDKDNTWINRRVTWDFGAVNGAGGGGGQGGAGGVADPSLSLARFNEALTAFKKFVRTCDTFGGKNHNYPLYESLPYHSSLFECIVATDVCASAEEFLCDDLPKEWLECFKAKEFKCPDGKLIPEYYQCDTFPDCEGAEDELGCQDLWYRCDDGSPILASESCDGRVQCPDGSDEKKCNITRFTCDFSKGIPEWDVCDGVPHCADKSDEKQTCATARCN